jgi:hypothetical protein
MSEQALVHASYAAILVWCLLAYLLTSTWED